MRVLLAALALWLLLSPAPALAGMGAAAQGPRLDDACRPALAGRQRYGYVATTAGWPQTFDVARLGAGWSSDLTRGAPAPGMDRALILRTPYGYRVDPAVLGPLVDANPGATWLVSNEPDSIWQDDLPPAEYARIYREVHLFLKGRDAGSRVAAGGIVQPTPLRLQYLDLVLQAYQARYGHALPADLWHIHNAILNEVSCSYDPAHCWGAQIPPGVEANVGVRRDVDDNDNLDIFKAQIWAFRRWMADRGYGGLPLLVSEFGVLMPEEYGFDAARVAAFMTGTFDFMATAGDPLLGDPLDGGRLVQRWAWFSLDVPAYDPQTAPTGFNGNLFDPQTAAITAHGLHFAGLAAGLPALDYAELALVRWQVPALGRALAPGETVSLPVTVRLGNSGTGPSGPFLVRLAYSGPRQGMQQQVVSGLSPSGSVELAFTLPDLVPGAYNLALEIDAQDQVPEPAECDNRPARRLVVPSHVAYLPLVALRAGAGSLASGLSPAASPGGDGDPGAAAGRGTAPPGIREFPLPQPGSYPGQLVLDEARGAVWLTQRDGNRLARFDLESETWTEYDLPTAGSRPWGLALDGDGGLWFAAPAVDKIGRLDPATGNVTEYGGLAAGSQPWGLAVDGRDPWFVWFTARAGNAIGRLDPAGGDVVSYPLALPNSLPSGLSVSPVWLFGVEHWYLWFAEPGSNLLGRMRLADNAIAEVAVPTASSAPQDVVWQGGVPWLTQGMGNKIATFGFGTTALWTEVPVITPASEPYGIALQGSDLVWFTERAGNRLGRYRVSTGVLLEYELPTPGSQPTDVAVDAQGCAWYAAPGADLLGRLCPRPLESVYLPLVRR
jgi:streptogramin lyase